MKNRSALAILTIAASLCFSCNQKTSEEKEKSSAAETKTETQKTTSDLIFEKGKKTSSEKFVGNLELDCQRRKC